MEKSFVITASDHINPEILVSAQQKILDALKLNTSELEQIRHSSESLMVRWGMLLGIILPIQIDVIKGFGFEADQAGLSAFNKILMEKQASNKLLQEINDQKWNFILDKSFGISECKRITLAEARNIISDIANAMIADEFLHQVDLLQSQMEAGASMLEKRKYLLTLLFPLHLSILEKHGFQGDDGYVLAQKSLSEYYYDPVIIEKAENAQRIVFGRAGLL